MRHQHSRPAEHPEQTEGRLIRWAPWYDLLVNFGSLGQARRLRKMTVNLAMIQPGNSVLDVGCGTGAVTLMAKPYAGEQGQVYGIDPAPEMIAVARSKAARKGLSIDFRVGVIEVLPFPDASIDVVTSSLMIHHLPDDLIVRGLTEVHRVLKPGGRLLVFDFMRPTKTFLNHLFIALTMHHGLKFGIEDLPKMLKDAKFSQAEKLDEKFLFFGFVRAVK
jgi:ubiquinone/menaquinone biosynthesis C-methylase UbiE